MAGHGSLDMADGRLRQNRVYTKVDHSCNHHFALIVIYAKSDDTPESEITAIVEAADSGDPSAQQKLSRYFSKGLTAEKYNEIRRKVYLLNHRTAISSRSIGLG